MEHLAPAPPKHGETQTHFGPLRHPDSAPPHHRDGGGRNGPAARERVLLRVLIDARVGIRPPRASGSSGFLKHIRHEAQRPEGERALCGKGAHDTSVSLLPPPAWSLGLTGSAPGWAVGAHMCGRKRMARRTSARGATFMAAIAAL